MNFALSFWVGVIIFVVGMFDKKTAGIITIAGFIPFFLAAVIATLGATNPTTANTSLAGVVDQGTNLIFDQIVGTYLVGILLGWTGPIIKGLVNIKN